MARLLVTATSEFRAYAVMFTVGFYLLFDVRRSITKGSTTDRFTTFARSEYSGMYWLIVSFKALLGLGAMLAIVLLAMGKPNWPFD